VKISLRCNVDLRLGKHLHDPSSLFERHSVSAIDHVSFSTISSYNDKWDFHVSGLRFGGLLMAFQNIVDWRGFAKQVKVGV